MLHTQLGLEARIGIGRFWALFAGMKKRKLAHNMIRYIPFLKAKRGGFIATDALVVSGLKGISGSLLSASESELLVSWPSK
jgi:hypothetical protein